MSEAGRQHTLTRRTIEIITLLCPSAHQQRSCTPPLALPFSLSTPWSSYPPLATFRDSLDAVYKAMRLPKQVAASLEWCGIAKLNWRRGDEVMTSRVEAQATLKVEEPSCQMKRLIRCNLDVKASRPRAHLRSL